MIEFDAEAPAIDNGNYFSMPYKSDSSALVIVSIPWDVTVSYGAGAALGAEAIKKASGQLDFFDLETKNSWKKGIATLETDPEIVIKSQRIRKLATDIIENLSSIEPNGDFSEQLEEVNKASRWLNEKVYNQTKDLLSQGKIVALVGGDHSTPFGAIKATAEQYPNLGMLHIDAHMDLRKAYEGFEFSHASIMYNVAENCPNISRFVQIGVRDFCQSEWEYAQNDKRFSVWTDDKIQYLKQDGECFSSIVKKMIEPLPENVYVSFDIDGLDPSLCPSTGTPVAGGLSFSEAKRILSEIVASGRKIVGFDLTEVVPNAENEFDANVGARILFKLCCLSLI